MFKYINISDNKITIKVIALIRVRWKRRKKFMGQPHRQNDFVTNILEDILGSRGGIDLSMTGFVCNLPQ